MVNRILFGIYSQDVPLGDLSSRWSTWGSYGRDGPHGGSIVKMVIPGGFYSLVNNVLFGIFSQDGHPGGCMVKMIVLGIERSIWSSWGLYSQIVILEILQFGSQSPLWDL